MKDNWVHTWTKKRIPAAVALYEKWAEECRVTECYNFWRGDQLQSPFDEYGQRRIQINKIHPEVKNNIPSLYYYRPFARLTASPENVDDPGTQIEDDTQLLQDTANHLIRDKTVQFRESTFLALKEAHWAFGCVEVGYSAEFIDAPSADKPPLKEKKDTKTNTQLPEQKESEPVDGLIDGLGTTEPETGLGLDQSMDQPAGPIVDPELVKLEAEIKELEEKLKSERFFVKHIPANHVLVSATDMPILENNDWIGYWEDMNLEDVKNCKSYKNVSGLKANTGQNSEVERKSEEELNEAVGDSDRVRIYKIWDLRTKQRLVFAEGHDKELLRKPFDRCPLKFLRFDIDPYHFLPRPLLLSKLDPQYEYNDSREYLRKVRNGTVPRYTYDSDAVEAAQMKKMETGEMGTYIPRKPGTTNPIEPVQQPSFSENAIQTLTLSDKEFADVGGVGGDARVANTKTATQAKIAETKSQVQDSFDRLLVAEWLSDIVKELLCLAIHNMSMEHVIAINVSSDSMYAMELGQRVKESFQRINADKLSKAEAGVEWNVVIDLESLSPVSEEEKFQKWMQGLSLLGNPALARLFSVSPALMKHTLNLLGIKSAKDQMMILESMQQVVQMEAMLAAQGQNVSKGVSPQPGGDKPGTPVPPGGPQPVGPAGPGASVPKGGPNA